MNLEATIRDTILSVAHQRNPTLVEVRLTDHLIRDLGLDSLELAQVVAELETQLGIDPFSREAIHNVLLVGELIQVYERALSATEPKGSKANP